MTDSATHQIVLASAAVGALALLALGARWLSGPDPRARERVLGAFLPVLLLAPLAQFGAIAFLPDSWRPRLAAPVPGARLVAAERASRPAMHDDSGAAGSAALAAPPQLRAGPTGRAWVAWADVPAILGAVYGAGVALSLLRLVRSVLAGARIVADARPADSPRCLAAWGEALGDWPAGVRLPRLLVSSRISTPACGGLLRPCVLVTLPWAKITTPCAPAGIVRSASSIARPAGMRTDDRTAGAVYGVGFDIAPTHLMVEMFR